MSTMSSVDACVLQGPQKPGTAKVLSFEAVAKGLCATSELGILHETHIHLGESRVHETAKENGSIALPPAIHNVTYFDTYFYKLC